MCFSFLLLGCFLLEKISGLEPGKDKQDFESIEEVKSHENSSQTEEEPEDVTWVPEAVLDVAYYLRKHKYNGYDPRYLMETGIVYRNLYMKFPRPPLKTLHWEVKKNCEPSFISCLKYLQEKVSNTELPRHLDSLTIIKHNGWTMENDEALINTTDLACQDLSERDETTFNVFRSPYDRFHWLITASYYMCWYTMNEEVHLKNFQDDCDNFANCLDPDLGLSNGDFRAKYDQPFACALYSFCPDPCCEEKHAVSPAVCVTSNPCRKHSPKDETCFLNRRENVDIDSIVLNHWNFSCNCDEDGMRWDPKSGMCVDIDECIEDPNICEFPSESCMNLPGSYTCVCNMMGYVEDDSGKCISDDILRRAIEPPKIPIHTKNKTIIDKFFDFVYHIKNVLSESQEIEKEELEQGISNTEREHKET